MAARIFLTWVAVHSVAFASVDPRREPPPALNKGAELSAYEARQVKNTLLREAANPIQKCFKTWEKSRPDFVSGKVHLDWEIQPNGRVKQLNIIHSDLPGMNGCVLKTLKTVVFPRPPQGQPYYVAHKFHFKRVEPGAP